MFCRTFWQVPTLLLLALTVVALCAWGDPSFTASDDPGAQIGPSEFTAISASDAPSVTAVSGLLEDTASGQVLWSVQPNVRRAPASLTKLMTALIVRKLDASGKVIYVSANAASTSGSSMGITAGELLTVDELLHGLFLPSGNDAAVALAEGTAGTVAAFVSLMNAEAQTMRLTGSHFANPDGLDDSGHYSTAHDLALMAIRVLHDPTLAVIVKTKKWDLAAGNGHAGYSLTNLNELLGTYAGADGVKTGTTPEAGENLIASATRNQHQLMAVVLGSTDRYADARSLLDFGWREWQWDTPALPTLVADGQDGVHLQVGAWSVVPVAPWRAGGAHLVLHVDPSALGAVTGARPQQVGTVELRVGQQSIGTAPMLASRP